MRREISYAENNDKRIFPIIIAGDERNTVPIRLTNHQRIDIRQNEEIGLDALSTALSFYLEDLAIRKQRAKEETEKIAHEKAAKEKAEQQAIDKAAREKAKHEATEKAAREKAERDAAEKDTKEKAEREAAEKASKEEPFDEKQNRVLEAAIESEVTVGKAAQLFVLIRRLNSKNIIATVKTVDDEVVLDEGSVSQKKSQLSFLLYKVRLVPQA